ncbi:MAG: hypothetical protein ACK5LT_05450 [Lachnospirales bacterium]
MLYKNQELTKELFKNPSAEYRGTPFFSWNCKVTKELLSKEIDDLKEMGMGGFHIHSRTGLDIKYLSDEFMELVKYANEKGKDNNMLTWLYDEDRWPSGAAGGLVTKDEKYRSRFLIFTPNKDREESNSIKFDSSSRAQRGSKRELLGKYEINIKNGYLYDYRRLGEGEKVNGETWYAYLEIAGTSPWFNNETYLNTLDKKAVERFIEETHEKYFKAIGSEFEKSIPAIFTDEPQFTHKDNLGFANEKKDIALPYTDDFHKTYKELYKNDFLDYLPEIIWDLPDNKISVARYRYHEHISEIFTNAFADTVGTWCKNHNIMLTGHMMEEPTLESQTRALGETMRAYRSFQLPGIDILCDHREYSTAKQAQSASHQYGCPGVLSELYGVTNWDFDFRGHKLQGDWQAALGVTTRVHHLTWMSMAGEAKRDYPASIGYQSPWYKEYSYVENHFARVNTALTRGKAKVNIGVIHPIESYWLYFGPDEQSSNKRSDLENNFDDIINWLIFGQMDFDFISESLLPNLYKKSNNKFLVGEMSYDVILVPNCITLRKTTLNALEEFNSTGGKVIFLGDYPQFIDASHSTKDIFTSYPLLPFTRGEIINTLEEYREISVKDEKGRLRDDLIYQIRWEKDERWLFMCHGKKPLNPDVVDVEKIKIELKGIWSPTLYNTLTGEISPYPASIENEKTIIEYEFFCHDSILFNLRHETPNPNIGTVNKIYKETYEIRNKVPVTLTEPNVLLLDMAEFSFDNSKWQENEEILRIDNIFREKLNYPLRMEALEQPWVTREKLDYDHTLSLRFTIESEINVKNPSIALENPELIEIIVNGSKINNEVNGWFVDQCIKTIPLPELPKGKSVIVLNIKYNKKTNIEWCYLLGYFGVEVNGSRAKIIEPVKELSFGDWTKQGLPFYAGNVTYHCPTNIENKSAMTVEVPQFRNPLLKIENTGDIIAYAPYEVELKAEKTIDITAYGNRINSFGAIHNCDKSAHWFGPNGWRTEGKKWSYEYQLAETGILISPRFKI